MHSIFDMSVKVKTHFMESTSASQVLTHDSPHIVHLNVSSSAFANQGSIPQKYTYEGENVNPPIEIGTLPKHTQSLALIVDSLDNTARLWTHWIVWNIPPIHHINENCVPGTQGLNDFWEHNYEGPSAPKGVQKYIFRVYALDCILHVNGLCQRTELELSLKNHVLGYGQLSGVYDWHNRA